MGWNASDTRPLTFNDCRVPEENLLGPRGAGFKQFLHILDIGRIGVAAMGVGLAQGALEQALPTPGSASAFGKPISKFQAIQSKLADMSTEIAAARLLVHKAALEKDARRNFTLTAAQAKLKTGRLAVRCAEEAVQIHGGYGFIEEYPVCRFYRDAKILTIGEGTDEVQQMVIARASGPRSGERRPPRRSGRKRPAHVPGAAAAHAPLPRRACRAPRTIGIDRSSRSIRCATQPCAVTGVVGHLRGRGSVWRSLSPRELYGAASSSMQRLLDRPGARAISRATR